MKILMVADSIFPDNIGGSYKYLYYLSQELARKGNRVCVVVSDKKGLPEKEVIDRIEVFRFRRNRRNKITDFFSFIFGAKRVFLDLIQHQTFDVIHFHWPLPALGVLLSQKVKNAKKIYTFHGPWPEEYLFEIEDQYPRFFLALLKKMFQTIERFVLKQMDVIHCASEFTKRQIITLYGEKLAEKVKIIPLGINLQGYQKAARLSQQATRQKLNLPLTPKIIFTARRLYKRMGLDELIEAYAGFVPQYPQSLLLIAGKGPEQGRLKERVRQLGLSSVKFLGFVREEDLPLYYRAADLFVLPTRKLEGFGLVILEAFAAHCPVLGTEIGAIKEVLGQFDPKLIVKGKTSQEIKNGLLFFFQHYQDKIDQKIFDKVERFRIELIAQQIEDVYQSK